MSNSKNANNGQGCKLIFTKFITKNGHRIYPKNGKVFCFSVSE